MPSDKVIVSVSALKDIIDQFEGMSRFTPRERADFYITILAAFVWGESVERKLSVNQVLAEVKAQIELVREPELAN